MRRLLGFFKQRWLISFFGIVALALLIWFLGPLFAFAGYEPFGPEPHRFLTIGVIFCTWLFNKIWSFFRAKRKNRKVIEDISVGPEPALSAEKQASQEELQTLRDRLQEALVTLKKARLGGHGGRRHLYQLPWYIVIGPPGSGKTTLLQNSNLKFPLSAEFGKDAIRGVGGTRNCDWWFTEDAVLLDTAGRYTTQDSQEEVDKTAWLGFLDLLKKHRRRRPINGALIAISISDLLQQRESEREAHAHTVRDRINELYEHFGIQFPVYLLFTKCDLLAGFMEYFDGLDRESRTQVWGMTFPLNEENDPAYDSELFEIEFKALEQRLQEQLIEKLEGEHGRERRDLIYTFPQQFSSLRQLTASFVDNTFRSTRYAHSAMFRGVYFTSATQEGSPIDRLMGTMASTFGLDRQNLAAASGGGKSYFINHLLRKVIFAESGLAGANLKLERKRAWLQRGAIAAILAATAAAALAWSTSFIGNRNYINETSIEAKALQEEIDGLDPSQNSPLATLPVLNKARQLPGGYAVKDQSTPWLLGFGLYQGDKLGNAATSLYRKLLRRIFLPRLMTRLEQQIRENSNNVDYLYEGLKVYLMLADDKHYDPNAIRAWINLDWERSLPLNISNEDRQSLLTHLDALTETRPTPLPRPLNAKLVQQARAKLARMPLSARIYQRLKLELSHNEIADFRISDKAGRDAPLVFTRKSGDPLNKGVPGLYTCAGYNELFVKNTETTTRQLTGERWIFGKSKQLKPSAKELQTLKDDVLKRYLKDYARHWERLLDDIQIVAFTNLSQVVEVLNILSGDQSPLRLLLEAVNHETSLGCITAKDKSLLDKANERLNSARSKLNRVLGETPRSDLGKRPRSPTDSVTRRFSPLHELVEGKNDSPPPLNNSLALLNELYVYLDSLLHAVGEELVTEQRNQVAQVTDKVKREAKRKPFPINRMMDNIADGSNSLVQGGVKQHLNEMWKSSVLPFCQKAIQGRYPVDPTSARAITYEDFTSFFAPGGTVDEYFNKYLAPSVDKSGKRWRWNSRDKTSPGVSPYALRQFQRADIVKNIFFRMGSQTPTVSFSLKPLAMDSSITQFIMDVDGQTLRYAHGPILSTPMKWPGPKQSGQVRIQLLPPLTGGSASGLVKEGPWALFRIFDQTSLTRTANPELFIVTFNIQGREAKLELRAGSAVNPFQLTDLQKFKCPRNL